MGRTTLELLHLKSIIVLHRQYLTHRNDLRFQFSRDSCLAAAERLLERQTEMHRVTQPGGQFHDMKWMITSLTMSDFTLAAMIICLDLTVTMRQGTVTFQNPKDVEDLHRYLEIIKSAHKIWRSLLESSEARIVSHALDSTIQRVGEYLSSRSVSASSETWQSSSKDADTPSYVTIDSADFTSDIDLMDYVDWVRSLNTTAMVERKLTAALRLLSITNSKIPILRSLIWTIGSWIRLGLWSLWMTNDAWTWC
jgi:hypothetical protein